MSPRPETISLCMIVKNEQQLLGRCLESVRGAVDELVVVDTGSQDRTMEIARSHGAKVVPWAWNHNFAEARNFSLEQTSGDWILWLDADEILRLPVPRPSLADVVGSGRLDAYSVPIQNNKLEGGFEFHYAIRLFRKRPGLRFVGKVHERIDESLLERGARIGYAPFFIEHTGYAIPPEEMERKLQRNIRLLREQVAEQPNNCFVHYYLGLTYIGLKEFQNSYRHLQTARDLQPATPNLSALIDNMLSYHHLDRGDYAGAEAIALRSLAVLPRQNTARMFLGIALFHQGRTRQALPLLRAAYQFLRLPVDRRQTELSQEHSYNQADLLWALTRCAADTGEPEAAFSFVRKALDLRPEDPTLHLAKGLCCLRLGAVDEAGRALTQAEALGFCGPELASAKLQWAVAKGDLDAGGAILLERGAELLACDAGQLAFQSWVDRGVRSGDASCLYPVLQLLAKRLPTVPCLADAVSFVAIQLGAYEDARAVLEGLGRQTPLPGDLLKRLAAVYWKLGLSNLAAATLQDLRSLQAHESAGAGGILVSSQ